MKPLALPTPEDVTLSRSPLTLVVCQVRHAPAPAVADPRKGLGVQEALGGRYPRIEQRRGFTAQVAVVGGGAPQLSHDASEAGWQMKSDDGSWTVTLMPDFFSLETSSYVNWSDFRTRLVDLVAAAIAAYDPAMEVRIGLRYVDEITDPKVTSPTDWAGWIRDELLGPLSHPDLGAAVRVVQQHVEFDAGDAYRVVLRHGTGRIEGEEQWAYLLDHDCFRQAGRELTSEGVMAAADDLHRIALQVFQNAITPDLYAYLRGGEGP
ncbi:MAG: TIGR04255 family protein [Actinomycetota bacterium]|nr:TIGR04255 family protein [Actinomycetota bacterium]